MIGRLRTVVIDAADIATLAEFYSQLLGLPIVWRDDDWITLGEQPIRLAIQLAPDHQPPSWPDPSRPQQFHLDVEVHDVDEAEARVLALGATSLPTPDDATDFRVYADPAGHPFCLVYNEPAA
jgi:catechol 2,3-dioxygenase-like lactoylglutathione lyase family enzyme